MKLEKLKKELYKPEPEFKGRPTAPEVFEPGRKEEGPRPEKEWEIIKPKEKRKWFDIFRFTLTPKQKKYFLIIGIILFILLSGLLVFVYWYGRTSFDKSWVSLNISGPERIISGEEVTYLVRYKNNTRTILKDAQLTFYWPEGTLTKGKSANLIETIPINDIAAGQEAEIQFQARIIGLKDSQKELKVRLSYQPAEIKARFENTADFKITIISTPLALNFDLPEEVVNGQLITVNLQYLNNSQDSFFDLVIKIDYPSGFKISSTYPQPQENIWQIEELKANQEGKILISGTLEGEKDETKTFYGHLGILKDGIFVPYVETVKSSYISLSVLSLEQTLNDAIDYVANLGDTLNYQIKYQNNAQVGIPAIKITAKFEAQVLDFAQLNLKNGSFDSLTSTITWDQVTVPELTLLNPGQKGQINFSVKVKDKIIIKNLEEKNFTITSTVKIDSSSVPLALMGRQVSQESKLITKINSHLTIDAKGYYQDTLLANSGLLPPKIGQTTTYTIYWQLTNLSNDLKDVKIEAYLPPYIKWLDKFKPTQIDIRYDSLSHKITWQVGNLEAATGLLKPAKFIAFQVALTPSIIQVGEVVELIKDSSISGIDTFTGENLTASDSQIKTDLPDDPTMAWEKGRVVE